MMPMEAVGGDATRKRGMLVREPGGIDTIPTIDSRGSALDH